MNQMNKENSPDCKKCKYFNPVKDPTRADPIYGFISGWCMSPTCKGYVKETETWLALICSDYKESKESDSDD